MCHEIYEIMTYDHLMDDMNRIVEKYELSDFLHLQDLFHIVYLFILFDEEFFHDEVDLY